MNYACYPHQHTMDYTRSTLEIMTCILPTEPDTEKMMRPQCLSYYATKVSNDMGRTRNDKCYHTMYHALCN